jgi:subtilisin-like proprotein convertase family protein
LAYSAKAVKAVRQTVAKVSASQAEAATDKPGAAQKAVAGPEDPATNEQREMLAKLRAAVVAGEPFSLEERFVLDKFELGRPIKQIEAETVISRVLFEEYIAKRPYSRGMFNLLVAYKEFVAKAGRTILDAPASLAKLDSSPLAKSNGRVNAPASPNAPLGVAFSEGFDDITTLTGAGWVQINRSEPLGTTGWFQGNPNTFPAHSGATNSYIGANFNNTGSVGTISNWLITPQISLNNGDTFKFWTRKATTDTFPDRLQVRLSTSGASTDVGTTSTSVGVFTTLLLDINPTLVTGVYPTVFTEFTVTVSGLGGPTDGRLAFRYFVTNGGANGANSDFIGIDTFSYSPPAAQVAFSGATIVSESCTPANNAADPGETVTMSVCLKNTGPVAATNVVATLQQNGFAGVLNPSGPQSYGAIPTGGVPVCRDFSFTVPSNLLCGGVAMPSFTLTDGGVALAPVTFNVNIGTTNAPLTTTTFTQNTPITIATTAPPTTGSPYPSTISVAAVTGTVVGVKVKLNGVNHTFPDDLDILLVGPTGASVVLMSDVGSGTDLVGTNLTFADSAAYLPDSAAIASGSFTPTNIGSGDTFPAPAPAASAGAPLNVTFANLDPNGTWSLYVVDDASGDGGSITSWSIELTTTSATPVINSTPFTNPASITINDGSSTAPAAATPYPSTINVSGIVGAIINVSVKLNGVNHTFPSDMDALLVGPTGVAYTLMSDTGGGTDAVNATLTLQDGATILPSTIAATSTLGPSNSGTGDIFPAPAPGSFLNAPSAGVASLLGSFGSLNANGTWSLFVVDDAAGDFGTISGGWTITFTTLNFPTTCSTCPTCTLTPPANITVSTAPNVCEAVVNYAAPVTSGTCGAVTCSPASGSTFPKGTTTVTCVSASGGGFASFTVTVNDTQKPAITCPANIVTTTSPGVCNRVVTYSAPTVSDNCPGVGAPTCAPASGSTFQKGVTTVNCTVADASGNTQTCSFTVTVNDNEAPAITCPAPIFVGTTGNSRVVNFTVPTPTDNCPGATAACVPASGSTFQVGVTTVTCTATDTSGNTAACTFPVTVNRLVTAALNDPLACTGPGNAVSSGFTVTNNGTVAQKVVVKVSLPVAQAGNPQGLPAGYPLLVALPDSCTASFGICTVVNATTIEWRAESSAMPPNSPLPAGATATITYQMQVNDLVPTGTPMTVTTTASFNDPNEVPSVTATNSITATCQAVGPGAIFPATSQVSDQKAGSILVYPIYTSSAVQNNQNSRISITNIHGSLPAFVHVYFVADTCSVSDAFICLTPNQTASFQAADLDPGTTGYLVAVAVNGASGCPVSFNYLIGDEYVKFSSGHAANLGAEAISAIAGGLPPCNPNSFTAELKFDGKSYNLLPTMLALDNLGSRADGNDTMLVVNAFGGDMRVTPATVGALFGVVYDDAENGFSFTLSSSDCQFRSIINNNTPRTTPRFDQVIPAGRTGWIRFWHRYGNAIFGAAINFNPNANATAGAFNGGHNLHKLRLTDTAVMTVPVFPPTC